MIGATHVRSGGDSADRGYPIVSSGCCYCGNVFFNFEDFVTKSSTDKDSVRTLNECQIERI